MSPSTLRLLGIVAVLVVVQWVLLPWFSWQSEKVAEIDRQLARLSERADVINSSSALLDDKEALSVSLGNLAVLSAPNNDGIELPLQQLVTAKLTDYQLELESFEWGEPVDGDIVPLRARITIAGKTQDFIDWQNSLLDSQPWIAAEEFSFRRLDPRWFEMQDLTGDIVIRVIVGGEQ